MAVSTAYELTQSHNVSSIGTVTLKDKLLTRLEFIVSKHVLAPAQLFVRIYSECLHLLSLHQLIYQINKFIFGKSFLAMLSSKNVLFISF